MQGDDIDQDFVINTGDDERRPLYYFVIAIISIITGLALIISGGVLYGYVGGIIPIDYGIIIDAGSIHTHSFLYKWLGSKDRGTGDVSQIDDCNYKGSISTLADPTSIAECLENVTNSLSLDVKRKTQLYLGATAGMRLLNISNPKEADMILLALKYALQQSRVTVKNVSIISGEEEGLYAWITVNYLADVLTLENVKSWNITYGALDLGGASTQIAFGVNSSLPKIWNNLTTVMLYGHKYDVVSRSYLCFGIEEAYRRHQSLLINDINTTDVSDPCLPSQSYIVSKARNLFGKPCTTNQKFNEWLHKLEERNDSAKVFKFDGGSNYGKCKKQVENLLNATECYTVGFKECPTKIAIPFHNMKYIAFSSFYYTTSFLNASDVSFSEFVTITEKWCNLTWPEMTTLHPETDQNNLRQYCFNAVFIIEWLTNTYGFNETLWSGLSFQQDINGSFIGWSLGYMISSTNALKAETASPPGISVTVLVVFILCSVIFITISLLFFIKYFLNANYYSRLYHERL